MIEKKRKAKKNLFNFLDSISACAVKKSIYRIIKKKSINSVCWPRQWKTCNANRSNKNLADPFFLPLFLRKNQIPTLYSNHFSFSIWFNQRKRNVGERAKFALNFAFRCETLSISLNNKWSNICRYIVIVHSFVVFCSEFDAISFN